MNNEELAEEYLQILADIDCSILDPYSPDCGDLNNISGLFLTSVPKNIQDAKYRIMIVGRETREWNVLNREKEERFTTLPEYIYRSMSIHQEFIEGELSRENARGSTFLNFARSITNKCGGDGIIYSNLFCFSWNKSSPVSCPYFGTIKHYSELLLKQQISYFKPNIIIFANGKDSTPYRQEFFPIKDTNKKGIDYVDYGIPNSHLWEFVLEENIRCFRIHHPAARAKGAAKARDFLLNLLPSC
ncbi:MAG: hypothetical protein RIR18_298 [Pseudomonadota bacterium]|jgi:hypothetical protein